LDPAETPIKEIRRFLSPYFLENIDKEKVWNGFKNFLNYIVLFLTFVTYPYLQYLIINLRY
jgi:hypothetical protein